MTNLTKAAVPFWLAVVRALWSLIVIVLILVAGPDAQTSLTEGAGSFVRALAGASAGFAIFTAAALLLRRGGAKAWWLAFAASIWCATGWLIAFRGSFVVGVGGVMCLVLGVSLLIPSIRRAILDLAPP